MVVSVSTWTNNLCDDSCILDVGDHVWLTHKSWVMYRKTKTELAATLINGLAKGLFKPERPLMPAVFERVCAGILHSRHTPRVMKKYYRQQVGL